MGDCIIFAPLPFRPSSSVRYKSSASHASADSDFNFQNAILFKVIHLWISMVRAWKTFFLDKVTCLSKILFKILLWIFNSTLIYTFVQNISSPNQCIFTHSHTPWWKVCANFNLVTEENYHRKVMSNCNPIHKCW